MQNVSLSHFYRHWDIFDFFKFRWKRIPYLSGFVRKGYCEIKIYLGSCKCLQCRVLRAWKSVRLTWGETKTQKVLLKKFTELPSIRDATVLLADPIKSPSQVHLIPPFPCYKPIILLLTPLPLLARKQAWSRPVYSNMKFGLISKSCHGIRVRNGEVKVLRLKLLCSCQKQAEIPRLNISVFNLICYRLNVDGNILEPPVILVFTACLGGQKNVRNRPRRQSEATFRVSPLFPRFSGEFKWLSCVFRAFNNLEGCLLAGATCWS